MADNKVVEEEAAEEIRVTDRRRITLDGNVKNASDEDAEFSDRDGNENPSFKPTYVEQLEARARAAEQQVAGVQRRFEQLRTELRRETDETRQRLNRAADDRVQTGKAEFVLALLPVIDNLQRALQAAEASGSVDALVNGLRGTLSGFESALGSAGVESVASVGATFDPELHEAVDTLKVDATRDNTVTAEYARGYRIGTRLLRPARVQVGRTQHQQEMRQQAAESSE